MATIVFCEDEALIRKMIGVMLRGAGHDLHFAPDAEEGLTLIEREQPDLIFTDMWMPGMDGVQLCNAVKAQPALAHIPVILATALTQSEQIEEFHRAGITAILKKPFGPAELREMVERHLPTR
jgi:two-component system cell cycle response regulator DivK